MDPPERDVPREPNGGVRSPPARERPWRARALVPRASQASRMTERPDPSTSQPAEQLRVGACVVDLPLREVHVPGTRRARRITPKAVGVLRMLAESPGRVVSREQLLSRVWPDTFPTDDVLTQAVTQLRKAFAGAEGEPYIETIAKGGYRLLAPVEWLESEPAASPAPRAVDPPAAAPAPPRRPRWFPGLVATLLAGVLAALAWALLLPGDTTPQEVAEPEPVPPPTLPAATQAPSYTLITSAPGFELSPTLSPDASMVAYAASLSGRRGTAILVQTTGPSTPRQLTRPGITEADRNPEWSPDGRQIAFIRAGPDERCRIIVMAASGAGARSVGDCERSASQVFAWTPDGHGLLFASARTPEGNTGIRRLDLDSGRWEVLEYTRSPSDIDTLPRVSPDGEWIVFARNAQLGGLWRIPLDGGVAEPLTSGSLEIRGWDWLDAGNVVFAGRAGARGRLYRLELATGVMTDVGIDDAHSPAVSRTARKLAFVQRHPQFGIYAIDRAGGVVPGGGGPADVSTLGEQVDRGASAEIPGRPAEQVFASSGRDMLPSIAPDGRQLVFASDRSGSYRLWWGELGSPGSLRLIEGVDPQARRLPEWSPDSRKVMLVGLDPSGQPGIYEVVAASGQVVQLPVPVEEPTQALYLPDPGRVLVGTREADGTRDLVLFERNETADWRELARLPDVAHTRVDATRERILFTRQSGDGLWQAGLDLAPASVGVVEPSLPTRARQRMWDVDREGRIAYIDQGPYCRTRLSYIGDGPLEPPRCLGLGRLPSASGFSIDPSGEVLYLPMAVRDGADIGFLALPEPLAVQERRATHPHN